MRMWATKSLLLLHYHEGKGYLKVEQPQSRAKLGNRDIECLH